MKTITMFWHYENEAHVLYRVIESNKIQEVAHFTVEGGGYFELYYSWPKGHPKGILFRNGSVAEMKDEITLEVDSLSTNCIEWLSTYKGNKCFKNSTLD